MNDRVRIYELARQMNIPNQDIIDTLRELGYDIKSHSSTIDGHVVGLLIAALGKKKKQEKSGVKPVINKAAKPAAKAAPPPEPVIVKPRVLSRRKPTPPPGTELPPAEPVVPVTTPIPATLAPAATVQQPPVGEDHAAPALPTAAETLPVSLAAAEIGDIAKLPVRVARPLDRPPELEAAASAQPQAPEKTEDKEKKEAEAVKEEVKEVEAAPAEPETEETKEPPPFGFTGQVVRPVQPSVPIRIAAPSIRATPPRAPKSHRVSPPERHLHSKREEKSRPAAVAIEVPKVVSITGALTVKELSERMNVSETEIIKRLFMKGIMRTVNQLVEPELAKDVATEMEYEVVGEEATVAEESAKEPEELSEADKAALVTRPPVVTIMGHVDHGKTSLLDAIRQTKFLLTDAEAGGITQHIGAYHVEVPGEDGSLRQIVFLDTPGHEAFTAMRARGAKATDIAILVVAADDGVMPQTIEAIDHAKAAVVPIIVAINKIDLPGADPDRVLTQLMEHQLLPDRYGGETVTVNVSAKKRTGLDELLEMILLVADMAELKANPDRPASGIIIEAELSRGRGAVATALVQNGTLHEGAFLVAGSASGRVRALFDDRGQRVKAAGPSMPVAVLGLDAVPQAGDRFEVVADSQAVKVLVEKRKEADGDRRRVTLESLHDLLAEGEVKELNVVVKADVQGTAEAIADQVRKLSSQEVQVKVVRTASGDITETDVHLAASCNAIIVGFNVQPDQNANKIQEAIGVDIRTYNIIYQITDDLEKAIQGLIQPLRQEVQTGTAEVRQIFKVGKSLTIAGAYVLNGKLQRGGIVKIERAGKTVHEGRLETLKRFKDDVKEVAQGFECGMGIEKFTDLQAGDLIHAYVIQETKREPTR